MEKEHTLSEAIGLIITGCIANVLKGFLLGIGVILALRLFN